MKASPKRCEHEREVIEAVRTSDWTAGLREHLEVCRACKEAAVVTGFLTRQSIEARREARVPAAGLIWWKAQIRARQEAVRKAAMPIDLAELAFALLALVGFVLAATREDVCLWEWVGESVRALGFGWAHVVIGAASLLALVVVPGVTFWLVLRAHERN